MRGIFGTLSMALIISFIFCFSGWSTAAGQGLGTISGMYQPLPSKDLNNLVGQIALYPDPLLAQVLQASTYPDQIKRVAQWIQSNPGSDPSSADLLADASVLAIAHYPSVINMMSKKISWTSQLGQAYVNQQSDVMGAIQYQRKQAQAQNNLISNSQQTVIAQGSTIQIVPASSEVIYVPVYDPVVVYTQPSTYSVAPLVAFGAGIAMGDWLNSDVDWDNHVVVYHGWPGGWGHAYYRGGTYYGPNSWRNTASGSGANGGQWKAGSAGGITEAGGVYSARGGTVQGPDGATVGGYKAAGAGPNGAAASRGWGAENGDNKAGGFSKTVATDNGIYNVHGGGASNGDQSAGKVTVSGVNKEGDYGSRTWSDSDRNSSYDRSGNMFSGYQNSDRASMASSRGFESRANSFSGSGGEGFHGFGGGGGRGRR